MWDTSSGRRLLTLAGHNKPISTVASSPDGNRIATAGRDSSVKLWDAHTGQFIRNLDCRCDWNFSVTFSSDDKHVAAAGNGGFILWDAQSGADVTNGQSINPTAGAAYSADGKTLALLGNQLTLHDPASFRELYRGPSDRDPKSGQWFNPHLSSSQKWP